MKSVKIFFTFLIFSITNVANAAMVAVNFEEYSGYNLFQDGKAVFKVAVKGMADVSYELMQKNNLTSDDLAYLVPHQANLRIINATADRMGLSKDKVMMNIDKYGNTTAATIPLCLVEYFRDGKLKKGDKIILSAFGAGYTWGSSYVVWGI